MVESLAKGLQAEMDRNQELLEQYHAVSRLPGVNTGFVTAMIRTDLKLATEALADQDVAKMVQAYRRLKENQ